MNEIWKDTYIYGEQYQVSNFGRVSESGRETADTSVIHAAGRTGDISGKWEVNMTKRMATAIFKDIHNDGTDVETKLTAIQDVIDMETHNGVTKTDMLEVLRWLVEEYI